MADTFNMSDVFISYSRKDSEFVHKVYDAFKAIEKEVWVDFEDIPLSADWWKEIEAGIDAAETFIFVLTPNSVRSDICLDEIKYAVNANKRIVPILHLDIVEDSDKERLHEQISAHNWIFFRDEDDFEEAFQKLLGAVETDLEHNRTHTRLLVRAKEWDDNTQNKSYLLRDEDLRHAESWLTEGFNKSPSPTNLHAQYINASRLHQTGRQRNMLFAVTVALGVAIALTVFSVFQWRDAQVARQLADQARDDAEVAREKAEESAILARSLALSAYTQDALSNDKTDLAMALALEAVDVDDGQIQVLGALRDAAYSGGTRLRLTDHSEFVWDVDFDSRGGLIISGSSDDTACIWEVRNGRKIACLGDGGTTHDSDVIAVGFFPYAPLALTADDTGVVKMWNADPQADNFGTELLSYTFDEPVGAFSIMPDGQSALIGLESGAIQQWVFDTDELVTYPDAHSEPVTAIAISGDGRVAISGGEDDVAIVWDTTTQEVLHVLEGHDNNVLSVAINADGTQALTGGQDNVLMLWDIVEGVNIFEIQGHDSGVADVAFGPNPTQITSASWDNSIRIWDVNTRRIVREFQGHTGGINGIDLSNDGRFIVSGSFDTDVRIWETASFIQVGFVEGDSSVIQDLAYSPDGTILATAHDSYDVLLWDVEGYQYFKTLTGQDGRVVSVDVSPNSEMVASVSDANDLIVWNWQTDEELLRVDDIASRLYMVLFGASDDIVYVALKDRIIWFDIATGVQSGEVEYQGEIGGNNSLSISPDGEYLLAGLRGSVDNLHLINLETGEVERKLVGHTDGVLSTAFNGDGTVGISGSWDNSARVWDLETGRSIHTLIAHTERVSSVDITADGQFAISGSNDRSMHLWTLERGIDELEYSAHTDRVQSVEFHPNDREMVSGSLDTTATVWRFPHPLDQLLGWIEMNRYVPELNCTEREVYQVEPYCVNEDAVEENNDED